jgi:hypothetical protein
MTDPAGATPADETSATEDLEAQDILADAIEDDDDSDAESLGDPGKRALDSMKDKWRVERDRRKALEAQIAAQSSEKSSDPEKIREQARAEARAEMLRDRAYDKIEAKAAKLFADPEDARALLARQIDDFIDDGKLDLEAIEDALESLLKKKPHLAATAQPRFNGSADGGARKGSGRPQQLTDNDLKRMTPDAIVAAREKGQLDELMGIT